MSGSAAQDPDSMDLNVPDEERLGGKLVRAGLISEHQLRHALEVQGRKGGKIADTLMHLGAMDSQRFLEFLAKQPGTPSISLRHCRIMQEIVDLVPEDICRERELIPIDRMGRLLTVGMVCPLDTETIAEIEAKTGLRVKPMLCPASEVKEAIQRYHGRYDV